MSYETTILIQTYERPHYLINIIDSIDMFDRSKTRFIVLDGSKEKQLENEAMCKSKNVEYHHFGPDVITNRRMLTGIELVETPIMSLLADDDRLNPVGYYQCVDFLRKNPDYSIVHGDYTFFQGNKINPDWFTVRSFEHDEPLDRLMDLATGYCATHYGVYRTEIIKTGMQEVLENIDPVGDWGWSELLIAFIAVITGKVKKLDVFYYARMYGDCISHTTQPILLESRPILALKPEFMEMHRKMRDVLLKYIPHNEQNKADISNAIELCFMSYYTSEMGGIWNFPAIINSYRNVLKLPNRPAEHEQPYPYKPFVRQERRDLSYYKIKPYVKTNDSSKNNEMEECKSQVKNTIQELINNRQFADAETIISEYISIVPNDMEMIMLKSKVLLLKSNVKVD